MDLTVLRPLAIVTLCLACLPLGGCWVFGVASAVGDNIESLKKIEVLAKYDGLENRTVAVLLQVDMQTAYEHPTAMANVSLNLAFTLRKNVHGVRVLDPTVALAWQHQNPSWPAMPLGKIAQELDVERLVVVDLYEYRLNPPGNRWLWDGLAAANVGIVEHDGLDPDAIQLARRSDAQGNRASIESIGRAMNVQQVIYVAVDRFTLSVDGASPRPGATVRVKVIDLEDQTRIFPGDDNGHLVEAELREPPQSMYVSTSGRRQIEDQLAMQLATDIAELFYEHEDRPLGGTLQAPRQRAQDR